MAKQTHNKPPAQKKIRTKEIGNENTLCHAFSSKDGHILTM